MQHNASILFIAVHYFKSINLCQFNQNRLGDILVENPTEHANAMLHDLRGNLLGNADKTKQQLYGTFDNRYPLKIMEHQMKSHKMIIDLPSTYL